MFSHFMLQVWIFLLISIGFAFGFPGEGRGRVHTQHPSNVHPVIVKRSPQFGNVDLTLTDTFAGDFQFQFPTPSLGFLGLG